MIRMSAIPAAPLRKAELRLFTSTISGLALLDLSIHWANMFAL